MDFRELKYLTVLAEEESISKAAERLFLSQSTLSQFLSSYEQDLGIQLFVRTTRGIRLSDNGRLYLERLKKIALDYQRAQNELWDNENLKGGRVSLGISSFRGEKMLPKILKNFYQDYPNVKVDVIEANSLALEDHLLNGDLDIAVVAMPTAKLKHEVSLLTKDEVYIVAPKYHSIMQHVHYKEHARGMWVDLKDVVRYDLILSYHDTILGTISRDLLAKHHLKYHALHDNITAQMAVAMTIEGLGLAFTYGSTTLPSNKYELLSIGPEGHFIDLGVAYSAKEYHSKAAEKMEEVVRRVYAEAQRQEYR